MRHQQRLSMGMLFTASLWMVGCQLPPEAGSSAVTGQTSGAHSNSQQQQQFKIEVAPTLVDCVGVAPMKCMQYRKVGETEWLNHYFGIEGFEYQPDYRYTLEIKQSAVLNPPADAPSLRWELVRVIEKHPVTR